MANPVPTPINLNDTTPAAPAASNQKAVNVRWQASGTWPRNASAYLNLYLIPIPGGYTPADITGFFQFAHGLSGTPIVLGCKMTSAGVIWSQEPDADATNLYLAASDSGLTGYVVVILP